MSGASAGRSLSGHLHPLPGFTHKEVVATISSDYYEGVWSVEYTDQFEAWWLTLSEQQQEAFDDRVQLLATTGPSLKRPVVGVIKASRHPNMKEMRVSKGEAL